jgi:aminopeptidase N
VFSKKTDKMRLLTAMLLIAAGLTTAAQERTITYHYDRSYDFYDVEIEVNHMNANLTIKPYDTLVIGEAEFTFKTLRGQIDSLVFDVRDLDIEWIKIDGIEAGFSTKGNNALIRPPLKLGWQTEHAILFKYTARPAEGLHFIGWNDPEQIKRKQIWAHRPHCWLPYTPAVLTAQMAVNVPGDLKVFSNGVRQDVVTNKDNTKTWHYRMNYPHPFFSTCLVIGDYAYKNLETARGLPVELWYYPDLEDHFETTYMYQLEMFNFLEKEFRFLYPYEVYRQAPVIDYMYAGMETTTATVFGDYLQVCDRGFLGRNYVNVNVHELIHQWFGNYVSHLKHRDVWLTESFATYFAKKFEQHVFGEDYYQNIRHTELQDTYTAARRNRFGVGHGSGGRERWYPKGSLVMDMLRDILGDKEFGAVMKFYLESHPYETAETNDFLQAIRKTTGRSMEWFFEQWIYRGDEPHYEIAYEQIVNNAGQAETRIQVDQIHQTDALTGLFKMPVTFQVYYTDNTISEKTAWIEKETAIVSIPNKDDKQVAFVLFDPNRKVIKNVTFKRNYDELIAQATHANNMIDRYDALIELKKFPHEVKKKDFLQIYANESFHLTKGEIIAQLSGKMDNDTEKLITSAINDPDDKVRLAVLQHIKTVPESLRGEYEKMLNDKSFLNVELALENLCTSFPGRYGSYLDRTQDEVGWRGRNIRIKWLEIAITNGGWAFEKELKQYASPSYEFETRINAMHALKRLNLVDEQVIRNMMEGLFHWNFRIRNAARESLTCLYNQNQFKPVIRQEMARPYYSTNQQRIMQDHFD